MRYEQTKSLRDVEFQRLSGAKHPTFETRREELKTAEAAKTKPERPGKLRLEDPLLRMLWYGREYRPLSQLGAALGSGEGTVSRQVQS